MAWLSSRRGVGLLGASLLIHLALAWGLGPRLLRDALPGAPASTDLRVSLRALPVAPPADPMREPVRLARTAEAGEMSPRPAGTAAAAAIHYWPAAQLERLSVPVSAPDVSHLSHTDLPAAAVRLRLFINARGQVDEVRVLGEEGELLWAPVCEMFLATAFIPAQRAGHDVASVQDLEINISELVRVL